MNNESMIRNSIIVPGQTIKGNTGEDNFGVHRLKYRKVKIARGKNPRSLEVSSLKAVRQRDSTLEVSFTVRIRADKKTPVLLSTPKGVLNQILISKNFTLDSAGSKDSNNRPYKLILYADVHSEKPINASGEYLHYYSFKVVFNEDIPFRLVNLVRYNPKNSSAENINEHFSTKLISRVRVIAIRNNPKTSRGTETTVQPGV